MKKGLILFAFITAAFLFSGCELAKELISPPEVSDDITAIDLNFSDGIIIIEAEPSDYEEADEEEAVEELEETAEDLEEAEEDLSEMDEETEAVDEEETEESESEEVVEEETELASEEVDYSGYPSFEFDEGELVSFPDLNAVDPEGNEITYTFTAPLNNEGEWQTTVGDAGQYLVTITVSDGTLESSQQVAIIVNSVNNPPEMEPIDDLEVDEGDTVSFSPEVNDADGDDVTITYSGWMDSDSYEASYEDSGTHLVTITASDGYSDVSQDVVVVVNNVNRAPEFTTLKSVAGIEGDLVELDYEVSDSDGDEATVTVSTPFTDGSWQTDIGDAGTYTVSLTASDGTDEVTETITVIINSLNNAPTIEAMDDEEVDEGDTVSLSPVVNDADGDELTITYTGWMTSDTYTTSYDDSGIHVVTITVSDGVSEATEEIVIVVNDVNLPPCLCLGDVPDYCVDYCA